MCRDCKVTEVRHDGPSPHACDLDRYHHPAPETDAWYRGDASVDHPSGVREVLDTDAYGNPSSVATCGTCGRSWDDGHVSGLTPTPSGRCPFEYDHAEQESWRETHGVPRRAYGNPLLPGNSFR